MSDSKQSATELHDEVQRRYGNAVDFIERLYARMQAADITQAELARMAGYETGNVSRWINGRVEPSLQTMLVLDEAVERLEEMTP